MTPIVPEQVPVGARVVIFAKDQPEYDPLPAAIDAAGVVMTEWALSAEDLATIVNGGRIRLWIYTSNRHLQPIALEVVE